MCVCGGGGMLDRGRAVLLVGVIAIAGEAQLSAEAGTPCGGDGEGWGVCQTSDAVLSEEAYP
jgi:hypothetical protein